MDDRRIIELLFSRSESGLEVLDQKYGQTCRRIAESILNNACDAEECVNDAYLALWNRIPSEEPESLPAYLYQIVRNVSISRYRKETAKRRNSRYDAALDELTESVASAADVEEELLAKELTAEIEEFLDGLPAEQRILFVRRYWYLETIPEIAKQIGLREKTVSVKLFRIRSKLKQYLEGKGVYVSGA